MSTSHRDARRSPQPWRAIEEALATQGPALSASPEERGWRWRRCGRSTPCWTACRPGRARPSCWRGSVYGDQLYPGFYTPGEARTAKVTLGVKF